jgi:hypothetical protein
VCPMPPFIITARHRAVACSPCDSAWPRTSGKSRRKKNANETNTKYKQEKQAMLRNSLIDYSMPQVPAGHERPATEDAARRIHCALLHPDIDPAALARAREWLHAQLAAAADLASDLPAGPDALFDWISHNNEQVGLQYRAYLDERRAGRPRRYFSNKSHALYFLKGVAPTKLVDGAWLYGLVDRWNDARFAPLIRIYLEELGEGVADKNHVVLYRKLLEAHGCEQWDTLSDHHFVQGAIQLSLAHHADAFLPEVIGFNLGYEQLPLHLLITAYELNELGIDPYYFTLHVTVDNAASGHARKSVQGLLDAMPRVDDASQFWRRVVNGYKLNLLGAGTASVIASFDLQRELLSVFTAKAAVGSHLHSDYCRVAGRTVNDWLSEPGALPAFLEKLEEVGWIRRHRDPQESRFWKLIHGERAEMFGVFNAYEQQLIHDWIAGDWNGKAAPGAPRRLTFKARQRLLDSLGQGQEHRPHGFAPRGVLREHFSHGHEQDGMNEFNRELRLLEERLASMSGKQEAMSLLTSLMSPASHHSAPGLMATRIYARLLG